MLGQLGEGDCGVRESTRRLITNIVQDELACIKTHMQHRRPLWQRLASATRNAEKTKKKVAEAAQNVIDAQIQFKEAEK
eukprot:6796448-Alexandrium_andersonii.AAC.1